MSTGDDGKLWPLNQLQTVPTDLAVKPKEASVMGSPVFPETRFRVKIRPAPILENGDRDAVFP